MVLMQVVAISSICAGILVPTCVDSNHCPRGQFCFAQTGQLSGRCRFCGTASPLVPYFETTDDETGYGPTKHEVIWNHCDYRSYPKDRLFGNYRSDTPDRFAGFNDSHVEAVCTRPIKAVPKYDVVMEGPDGAQVVKSFSGGNVPPGITPAYEWKEGVGDEYPAESVASWCDTCVHALTRDVSSWNDHGMYRTNLMAMSVLDVSATRQLKIFAACMFCCSCCGLTIAEPVSGILLTSAHQNTVQWGTVWMCSYVVGLSIVGELKDATLCSIAVERGREQLSRGWMWALWLLATIRVHAFLGGVLSSIPVVILSRGGDAMTVAFNTVAILFLTEVECVGSSCHHCFCVVF